MEGIGAEVSQKIRSAIKAKLMEIGVYVDEELPDYVMVMVANKRSKEQMDDDLLLFLGKHTSLFTTWLHQVLQKLQEVTVANLGGIKRKLSDDLIKKRKVKPDTEKKETRKKIKVESEDDNEQDLATTFKGTNKDKKDTDKSVNEDYDSSSSKHHSEELKRKGKTDLRSSAGQVKESKTRSKSNKQLEESTSNSEEQQQLDEKQKNAFSKTQSTSSQADDIDDEDCINIRTDGELLDTAEEANVEEPQKRDKESSSTSKSNRSANKKQASDRRCPETSKEKPKQTDHNKRQNSLSPSTTNAVTKVVDARELLNRKKAAKQLDSDIRTRTRSEDRSVSPIRKRKSDTKDNNIRSNREEKDKSKRPGQDGERESTSRRELKDDAKDRKSERVRDLSSTKWREERARRTESNWDNRRDESNESTARRTTKNNSDDWSSRPSKIARVSDNWKTERENDSFGKRREPEEPRKRGGMLSQVVPRPVEPEEDVETPVPSVVKVTPRPRRPPSQQPSSNLIMKAISEANRSLANVPPRPDSTQQARKKPRFTRQLRELERIPPEKIAVSITNPLALQNVGENTKTTEESREGLVSPKGDGSTSKRSLTNLTVEVTSSEPDNTVQNDINSIEEWDNKEELVEEESQQQEEVEEPALELDPPANLDEPLEEPQFVVTLNGYDPDNLYSQSEVDQGEDVDGDEWLKQAGDQEPILTSTPDETASPRLKRERHSSPIVIMNAPAVNHSNLIEVEIVKTKSTDRCKYWPACRLADKCTFYHPTKPCKVFPACKFGDACLYIHPQCKFNALCTRKDCVFAHTPAFTPLQPAATTKTKALYAASALQPCKFYPNCTNANCQFAHPHRACRYGLYCTKKDCSFDHGQVAPVDKLKWTRGPST